MKELGVKAQARVLGYATYAREPEWFTLAPVGAITRLLKQLNMRTSAVDLFEINEAFAVVPLVAMKDLGIPHDKCNVHGGAVALGHPIGASGARTLVTLLNAMRERGAKIGVSRYVSVAVGGSDGGRTLLKSCRGPEVYSRAKFQRYDYSIHWKVIPDVHSLSNHHGERVRAALGFMPGFKQAPGLIVVLLLLVILNANLFLAAVIGGVCKLLSLALPHFLCGRFLLDGPTQGLFRWAINAPGLALYGATITTTGGLLGIVVGLPAGFGSSALVNGYRPKMVALEEGSENAPVLVEMGEGFDLHLYRRQQGKESYQELLETKVGN